MKRYLLYFLLTSLIWLSSCKKNSLPPSQQATDSAVFYAKAEINGTAVDLEAGKNNYFMYSSHHQDTNKVYVYQADMKQTSCAGNCGYAFSFLINDYRVSSQSSAMMPDSALVDGEYEYNDGDIPPLYFNGVFNPTVSDPSLHAPFIWTFNNGSTTQTFSSGAGQAVNYQFRNKETYSVSCKIADASTPAHTNVFNIGDPLQASIDVSCNSAFWFNYTVTPSQNLNNTYNWEFGDGNTNPTTLQTTYHNFPSTFPKYYTTKLTVNSGTNTCTSYYQIPAFNSTVSPHANFTHSFTAVPNTRALSTITILCNDMATGNIYSSGKINQSGSNFEIVSVEEYKTNESGQKTKKLKILFNCILKNTANTNTITITNGEAVIAVSYN